ncbi:gamma-glutamyl hydrolase, partial [Striga asiatica]
MRGLDLVIYTSSHPFSHSTYAVPFEAYLSLKTLINHEQSSSEPPLMAPPPPPPHNPSPSASDYSNSAASASAYRPPIPLSSITTAAAAASSSSSSGVMNYLWIPLLLALSKELAGSATAGSTASLLSLPSQAGGFPAVSRCPTEDPNLNFRPVIGILSHPGDGASGRLSNDSDASYIAASYVKFVESAGARVIPLIYNEPLEVLNDKLKLVNGVILTGGRAKTGLYFKVVGSIFKNVLKKNDGGDHFPLLAICLGFELLTMIVSEDQNILENFNAVNQASTLQFIEGINLKRTVFQRFPPPLLEKLRTECLVMQNHRLGISPVKFQGTKNLSSFFEILTTSTDQDGKVYVSTVQAHKYPVTAVQWHPEKNAFEWGLSRIPHSEDAVEVTQLVANFIVREARKSMNRPSPLEVLDNVIYNYSPTYCGKAGRGFDEVYIFSSIPKLSGKMLKIFHFTILFLNLLPFSSHIVYSKSSGFTLKLIPWDFPQSPFYQPNLTQTQKVQIMAMSSKARSKIYPVEKNGTSNTKIQIPMIKDKDLRYSVNIKIGNPGNEATLLLDTGSGAIWTDCQQSNPHYNSKRSKTYKKLPCQHPMCKMAKNFCQCIKGKCVCTLRYGIEGGIKTEVHAILLSDTFTLPLKNKSSRTFKEMIFGCTNRSPVFSGILGLNKLPVSLISQIRKSVRGQYSYCLHQGHGYLRFGDDIPKIGKDVKTTPILHPSAETMCLDLKDISVAGKKLGISPAIFSYSQGGFFIDTGTQITVLKRQAYDKVMKAFANFYDVRLKRASKKIQHLDLCYKQNSTMSSNYANMTFHLQGADYVPSHMYVAPEIGIMCIGIMPGELSILGALQQFNKRSPVSLLSQIREESEGRYSYCLHSGDSYLTLGEDISSQVTAKEAYNKVSQAFERHLKGKLKKMAVAQGNLKPCYRVTAGFNNFPTMTFHFQGADFEAKITHIVDDAT